LSPYLKILRIPNLLIIILTQYLLRICVIGTFYGFGGSYPAVGEFDFVLLVLSTLLIASGGYVINDIYDAKPDKVNKPEKILVGKVIDRSKAYILYYSLTGFGILIGFYLGFRVDYFLLGFIYVAIAMMLYFYSNRYQRTVLWGNLVVSILSAMVILIVWLFEFFALRSNLIIYAEVYKQIPVITVVTIGYAVFAFLVTMIREIYKDVEDYDGDKQADYSTLPIHKSTRTSKILAIVLILVCILLLGYGQYILYIRNYTLVFWYLIIAVQSLFIFLFYNTIKAKNKRRLSFPEQCNENYYDSRNFIHAVVLC